MPRPGNSLDGAPAVPLGVSVQYVLRVLPKHNEPLPDRDKGLYKSAITLIGRGYSGVTIHRVGAAVRSKANTPHGNFPNARTVALLAGNPPAVTACACVDGLKNGSLLVLFNATEHDARALQPVLLLGIAKTAFEYANLPFLLALVQTGEKPNFQGLGFCPLKARGQAQFQERPWYQDLSKSIGLVHEGLYMGAGTELWLLETENAAERLDAYIQQHFSAAAASARGGAGAGAGTAAAEAGRAGASTTGVGPPVAATAAVGARATGAGGGAPLESASSAPGPGSTSDPIEATGQQNGRRRPAGRPSARPSAVAVAIAEAPAARTSGSNADADAAVGDKVAAGGEVTKPSSRPAPPRQTLPRLGVELPPRHPGSAGNTEGRARTPAVAAAAGSDGAGAAGSGGVGVPSGGGGGSAGGAGGSAGGGLGQRLDTVRAGSVPPWLETVKNSGTDMESDDSFDSFESYGEPSDSEDAQGYSNGSGASSSGCSSFSSDDAIGSSSQEATSAAEGDIAERSAPGGAGEGGSNAFAAAAGAAGGADVIVPPARKKPRLEGALSDSPPSPSPQPPPAPTCERRHQDGVDQFDLESGMTARAVGAAALDQPMAPPLQRRRNSGPNAVEALPKAAPHEDGLSSYSLGATAGGQGGDCDGGPSGNAASVPGLPRPVAAAGAGAEAAAATRDGAAAAAAGRAAAAAGCGAAAPAAGVAAAAAAAAAVAAAAADAAHPGTDVTVGTSMALSPSPRHPAQEGDEAACVACSELPGAEGAGGSSAVDGEAAQGRGPQMQQSRPQPRQQEGAASGGALAVMGGRSAGLDGPNAQGAAQPGEGGGGDRVRLSGQLGGAVEPARQAQHALEDQRQEPLQQQQQQQPPQLESEGQQWLQPVQPQQPQPLQQPAEQPQQQDRRHQQRTDGELPRLKGDEQRPLQQDQGQLAQGHHRHQLAQTHQRQQAPAPAQLQPQGRPQRQGQVIFATIGSVRLAGAPPALARVLYGSGESAARSQPDSRGPPVKRRRVALHTAADVRPGRAGDGAGGEAAADIYPPGGVSRHQRPPPPPQHHQPQHQQHQQQPHPGPTRAYPAVVTQPGHGFWRWRRPPPENEEPRTGSLAAGLVASMALFGMRPMRPAAAVAAAAAAATARPAAAVAAGAPGPSQTAQPPCSAHAVAAQASDRGAVGDASWKPGVPAVEGGGFAAATGFPATCSRAGQHAKGHHGGGGSGTCHAVAGLSDGSSSRHSGSSLHWATAVKREVAQLVSLAMLDIAHDVNQLDEYELLQLLSDLGMDLPPGAPRAQLRPPMLQSQLPGDPQPPHLRPQPHQLTDCCPPEVPPSETAPRSGDNAPHDGQPRDSGAPDSALARLTDLNLGTTSAPAPALAPAPVAVPVVLQASQPRGAPSSIAAKVMVDLVRMRLQTRLARMVHGTAATEAAAAAVDGGAGAGGLGAGAPTGPAGVNAAAAPAATPAAVVAAAGASGDVVQPTAPAPEICAALPPGGPTQRRSAPAPPATQPSPPTPLPVPVTPAATPVPVAPVTAPVLIAATTTAATAAADVTGKATRTEVTTGPVAAAGPVPVPAPGSVSIHPGAPTARAAAPLQVPASHSATPAKAGRLSSEAAAAAAAVAAASCAAAAPAGLLPPVAAAATALPDRPAEGRKRSRDAARDADAPAVDQATDHPARRSAQGHGLRGGSGGSGAESPTAPRQSSPCRQWPLGNAGWPPDRDPGPSAATAAAAAATAEPRGGRTPRAAALAAERVWKSLDPPDVLSPSRRLRQECGGAGGRDRQASGPLAAAELVAAATKGVAVGTARVSQSAARSPPPPQAPMGSPADNPAPTRSPVQPDDGQLGGAGQGHGQAGPCQQPARARPQEWQRRVPPGKAGGAGSQSHTTKAPASGTPPPQGHRAPSVLRTRELCLGGGCRSLEVPEPKALHEKLKPPASIPTEDWSSMVHRVLQILKGQPPGMWHSRTFIMDRLLARIGPGKNGPRAEQPPSAPAPAGTIAVASSSAPAASAGAAHEEAPTGPTGPLTAALSSPSLSSSSSQGQHQQQDEHPQLEIQQLAGALEGTSAGAGGGALGGADGDCGSGDDDCNHECTAGGTGGRWLSPPWHYTELMRQLSNAVFPCGAVLQRVRVERYTAYYYRVRPPDDYASDDDGVGVKDAATAGVLGDREVATPNAAAAVPGSGAAAIVGGSGGEVALPSALLEAASGSGSGTLLIRPTLQGHNSSMPRRAAAVAAKPLPVPPPRPLGLGIGLCVGLGPSLSSGGLPSRAGSGLVSTRTPSAAAAAASSAAAAADAAAPAAPTAGGARSLAAVAAAAAAPPPAGSRLGATPMAMDCNNGLWYLAEVVKEEVVKDLVQLQFKGFDEPPFWCSASNPKLWWGGNEIMWHNVRRQEGSWVPKPWMEPFKVLGPVEVEQALLWAATTAGLTTHKGKKATRRRHRGGGANASGAGGSAGSGDGGSATPAQVLGPLCGRESGGDAAMVVEAPSAPAPTPAAAATSAAAATAAAATRAAAWTAFAGASAAVMNAAAAGQPSGSASPPDGDGSDSGRGVGASGCNSSGGGGGISGWIGHALSAALMHQRLRAVGAVTAAAVMAAQAQGWRCVGQTADNDLRQVWGNSANPGSGKPGHTQRQPHAGVPAGG